MALTLPDPNKVPGDANHTSDTNLIIEAINTLKSEVDGIPAGATGAKGDTGEPGAAGTPATVTVGSTTTSAAGGNAAVTNSGTASNAILDFTIPRGAAGPKGDTGAQGPQGPPGEPGTPGANGAGVKPGGLENQVLAKASNSDFDTQWVFPGTAPVTSVDGRQGVVTLDDLYDANGAAAAVAGDLTTHEGLTTSVHGITDTANLVYTSDSRLSDARTPTAHATSHESGGADELELAPSQITGTAVVDSDSRLTDARTPTAHSTSHESGGSDELELAPSQITGTAVVDNDARLTDARTPTLHASSHESGGADELELAPSQITGTAVVDSDSRLTDARTPTAHATSHESGGSDELELAPSQITGTAVVDSDSRLTDARTPTAHASSHESGGADELELAPAQITGTAVVEASANLVQFVTSGTRPSPATEGQIIYETDTDSYFGYNGSDWVSVGGGAKGGGTNQVFYENETNVTDSYTITTGYNALSAGPITVDAGATVTVPSGSVWTVV